MLVDELVIGRLWLLRVHRHQVQCDVQNVARKQHLSKVLTQALNRVVASFHY